MSSETIRAQGRPGVDWGRAEFVLTGLAFLGFLSVPIRMKTIYSGLPAHPLFVHVPVILVPATVITAIVFMFRTDWFSRYAIALSVVSIVAMSSLFLALQSGAALRGALNLPGNDANLISQHSQAAHILAILYVLFTATLIVTFAAQRISAGRPTGWGSWTGCSPLQRSSRRSASSSCCWRSALPSWSSASAISARKRCGPAGCRPGKASVRPAAHFRRPLREPRPGPPGADLRPRRRP